MCFMKNMEVCVIQAFGRLNQEAQTQRVPINFGEEEGRIFKWAKIMNKREEKWATQTLEKALSFTIHHRYVN